MVESWVSLEDQLGESWCILENQYLEIPLKIQTPSKYLRMVILMLSMIRMNIPIILSIRLIILVSLSQLG